MTRILTACILMTLSGCAPSTATLIDKAMKTGDWRAVNARLDARARREARRGPACPDGASALCVSDSGDVACRCVESAAARYELGGVLR
jgi:hypothetical protein